ncbi:hypothetical protein HID58_049129, partial [Brassica napus]
VFRSSETVTKVGKSLHRSFHTLSQKYQSVVFLRFGVVPVDVFTTREAAEEVLKTHDLETCTRPKLAATKLFSCNYKGHWLCSVRLRCSSSSARKLKAFRYIEKNCSSRNSRNQLRHKILVDLRKSLFSLTASIICRLAFGQNFHECDLSTWTKLKSLCSNRISGQHSDLHKAFARLSNFFQHVIDDHLKPGQPEDHSDIISVMLNMINKQSKDVSLAGVNAGAITMIWAMIELTIHPKVLKEIQQEIRVTLGDNKEKITLHPPAPLLLPRETMSDIKVIGYNIPKNTMIEIATLTHDRGRDPIVGQTLTSLSPRGYKGQHFEFLSFAGG